MKKLIYISTVMGNNNFLFFMNLKFLLKYILIFKGSIDETFGRFHSYRMSKCAGNMAFRGFSLELK